LIQRAAELDPTIGRIATAEIYDFARDKEKAISAYKNALNSSTNVWRIYVQLGILEINLGMPEEAESTLRLVEPGEVINPLLFLPQAMYGYSRLGLKEDVERLATYLEEISVGRRVPAASRILVSLSQGDIDTTLSLLNTAAIEKVPYDAPNLLMRIKLNVFEDPILNQPEFVEVRERLGYTN
jgi:hypothetical protein